MSWTAGGGREQSVDKLPPEKQATKDVGSPLQTECETNIDE
ncbi:hypothetical protein PF003_g38435 [Phytophthora fragariae]|nr:hypothetical protein PF003_g38435 [Phytophthora fragariae]